MDLIVGVFGSDWPVWAGAVAALALGLVGSLVLATGRRGLTGTTLVAPWRWASCSLAALVLVEVLVGCFGAPHGEAWASHLRYAAAVTTFGPLAALLGAKRPQQRAWQLIVLALLVTLMLPSGRALLFDAGRAPSVPAAWRFFLAAWIAVGLINHLPTRFWPSCGLVGGAQVSLLADYLPWLPLAYPEALSLLGLALLVLAGVLVALGVPRPRPAARPRRAGVDRLWLDFRDAFGVVWGLRIAERFNASASLYGWQVWLGWTGLVVADNGVGSGDRGEAQLPAELTDRMHETLRTLLRRFVSPEWIARRLAGN